MRVTGYVFHTNHRGHTITSKDLCVECGEAADCFHHIIPYSRGGRTVVSLCEKCHDKVHDDSGAEISRRKLSREGLQRRKLAGLPLGKPFKFDENTRAAIVADRMAGLSLRKLANKYNVQPSRISTVLRKHFNGTTGPVALRSNGSIPRRWVELKGEDNETK